MKWYLMPMYAFYAILAILIGLAVLMFNPRLLDCFGDNERLMSNRFNKWNR